MNIIRIDPEKLTANRITLAQAANIDGIVWIDISPDDRQWVYDLETHLGIQIEDQHILDTENINHPPFYDASVQYDMLVFRSVKLIPTENTEFNLEFFPIVFFVTEKFLITVHPTKETHCQAAQERWLHGIGLRSPISSVGVMCTLLSHWTDDYLSLRMPFSEHLENLQKHLLNPNARFNDWNLLLNAGSQLRNYRMSTVDPQEVALDKWRDESNLTLDARTQVRLNDLLEHFRRVSVAAEVLQHDMENLMQIYFSATNQRTNETMRILTVASVIFLPLNLLAGMFGMNFSHIPGADVQSGFYIMLGAMILLTLFVLGLFRWKNWL